MHKTSEALTAIHLGIASQSALWLRHSMPPHRLAYLVRFKNNIQQHLQTQANVFSFPTNDYLCNWTIQRNLARAYWFRNLYVEYLLDGWATTVLDMGKIHNSSLWEGKTAIIWLSQRTQHLGSTMGHGVLPFLLQLLLYYNSYAGWYHCEQCIVDRRMLHFSFDLVVWHSHCLNNSAWYQASVHLCIVWNCHWNK